MINLLRMDLYRMRKGKSHLVILILVAVSGLAITPFTWLMTMVANMFAEVPVTLPKTANLIPILTSPFPLLNGMLTMLAACSFFYSDIEFGYIKNIAGQMPKKGYTMLSRYLAVMAQTLLYMVVGVVCNLLGTIIFQQIVVEGSIAHALLVFVLKFLLMHACCAILLLVTAVFHSKSLGSVLAVLMGTGVLSLVYMGISSGLNQLLKLKNFALADYMPDQLLASAEPKTAVSLIVSAVTIAIFLTLSIRAFDRRDVK